MIRAVLFDLGGTLDGDGLHWLDRFAAMYADAGVFLPGQRVREAFDEAERRAAADDEMAVAHLETMIERHVGWQREHLPAAAGQEPRDDDGVARGTCAARLRRSVARRHPAAAPRRALDGIRGKDRRVKAGIIAAGRGDRLSNGSAVLKPLVRVGGQTLIERVL